MTTLCLSRDEIKELTRSHIRVNQVAFLLKNGIRHYLDKHGHPVVTRAALEGSRELAQPTGWKSNKAA
jgi:hypothetical protein